MTTRSPFVCVGLLSLSACTSEKRTLVAPEGTAPARARWVTESGSPVAPLVADAAPSSQALTGPHDGGAATVGDAEAANGELAAPTSNCDALNAPKDPCAAVAAIAAHLQSGERPCSLKNRGGALDVNLLDVASGSSVFGCTDKPSTGECRPRPMATPTIRCSVAVPAGGAALDATALHALLKRCAGQDDAGAFVLPPIGMDDSIDETFGARKGWSAARRLPENQALVSEWCTSPYDTSRYEPGPILGTIYTFEMFVTRVPDGDTQPTQGVK